MSEHRQLAVVMFTDIEGYTALMQQDEQLALKKLSRFREKLFEEVEKFKGKIIQFYGDGCLIIFTNATDAVNCALVLQEAFKQGTLVPVRVGLHLGDVIFKDDNVFGDCVNIASRVESMGIPGAVLLSDAVQKQLKNKPGLELESLGKYEFKNVDEPMEIFALKNNGMNVPDRAGISGKFKERSVGKSIAVLPFTNLSNDPEQEYFSDGMAEEILNSLTHLHDLKVAGRISSFQFKGKNTDLREIGKKLGVSTILEGSVRKQGNQLRITAQLINVEDGFHLWSERYDREMVDVFAIQDEIALAITEKLKITLLQIDRQLITKNYEPIPEAYELYLKGRFHIIRRGASILTALQCFQKSLEIDPDFALAHAEYSDANLLLATYGLVPPKLVMPQAKLSAEKALQLDPSLSEAYCSLAYYYACYEWNWAEARKNFLASLALNPRYIEVHLRYGCNFLSWVDGNFSEGEKHGEKAIKLEPLHSVCYGTHSLILQTAGKYKEGLEICKQGLQLDSNSFLCQINQGTLYMLLGEHEEAVASHESAMKFSNRHHFAVNGLIWATCSKGDFEKAAELMDELKERMKKEYIAKTFTGISAAYMGDMDLAFEYLGKACDEKDPVLLTLKHEKWIPAQLKQDPRYQEILERIGFPG